ncbi:MAG TPA: GNAT family N-acetyltransferase [Acidimicrobiia bacterium]|nr:GNAT family N-acetyltransferase [Acidimicrobiia bacterium]
MVPEVRTERLRLRAWRPEDRAAYASLNAAPAVAEYLGGPLEPAASDGFVARYEAHWAREGFGVWAVEVLDGPSFVGSIGLQRVADVLPCAPAVEVTWRLARAAWGHGYATEGARAALTFGFTTAGLGEVVAFTAAANARSRAVMDRLGMAHDPADDFEHPRLARDDPLRSHVLYRRRAAGWPA